MENFQNDIAHLISLLTSGFFISSVVNSHSINLIEMSSWSFSFFRRRIGKFRYKYRSSNEQIFHSVRIRTSQGKSSFQYYGHKRLPIDKLNIRIIANKVINQYFFLLWLVSGYYEISRHDFVWSRITGLNNYCVFFSNFHLSSCLQWCHYHCDCNKNDWTTLFRQGSVQYAICSSTTARLV